MPEVKLPSVKLPDIRPPQISLPAIRLPEIKLPQINMSIMTEKGGHRILININETNIETPPLEHLVYYAGIAVLVQVNIMELPIAAALVAGHLLIGLTHRPGLEALGEVITEA